jgi:hypothetical protein
VAIDLRQLGLRRQPVVGRGHGVAGVQVPREVRGVDHRATAQNQCPAVQPDENRAVEGIVLRGDIGVKRATVDSLVHVGRRAHSGSPPSTARCPGLQIEPTPRRATAILPRL